MGDVLSLIEKAEEVSDADAGRGARAQDPQASSSRSRTSSRRCARCGKMGPLSNVLGMMPGMGKAMKQLRQVEHGRARARPARGDHPLDDARPSGPDPTLIDGSRRKRIAQGSGTTVQAVNQLVKQFGQMRKMMAQLAKGKMPDPQQLMRGMRNLANLRAAMAVRIRLRRVGSRKNPIWRIVVADRRSPRDGRTIETIGHYNPQTDPR